LIFNQKGQTLMELIVVMAVSVIITGALVFAIISSLRNAQFAKNQSQATKLAQEALEKVRSGRDRGSAISPFQMGGTTIDSWSDPDLWSQQISQNCSPNCYFIFNSSGVLQLLGAGSDIPSNAENPLNDGKFKRVVTISDDVTYQTQKTISVLVRWTDFSGNHESKLSTILRKI
jgi:type II secretory pathway pseudopilin PulG